MRHGLSLIIAFEISHSMLSLPLLCTVLSSMSWYLIIIIILFGFGPSNMQRLSRRSNSSHPTSDACPSLVLLKSRTLADIVLAIPTCHPLVHCSPTLGGSSTRGRNAPKHGDIFFLVAKRKLPPRVRVSCYHLLCAVLFKSSRFMSRRACTPLNSRYAIFHATTLLTLISSPSDRMNNSRFTFRRTANALTIPPPQSDGYGLFFKSYLRFCDIWQAWVRFTVANLLMHALLKFVCGALPGFDPSGDFSRATIRATYTICTASVFWTAIPRVLALAACVTLRYAECKNVRGLGPADELHQLLVPEVLKVPGVCRVLVNAWTVVVCVIAAFMVAGPTRGKAMDPLHAAVIGALGRVVCAAYEAWCPWDIMTLGEEEEVPRG